MNGRIVYEYDVKMIDAFPEYDPATWNKKKLSVKPMWSVNEAWHVEVLKTMAESEIGVRRAFLRLLRMNGVHHRQGECYVDYDGDCWTLRKRKTDEPLFTCEPINYW